MVFTLIYHIIVEIGLKYYIDFDNTDIKFWNTDFLTFLPKLAIF